MDVGRRLLYFRPRPQPDELLSSWLVRLAWANRQKLHPFSRKHFGRDVRMWTTDLDRMPPVRVMALLSQLTGVSRRRIWEGTLPAYEGVLFERRASAGQLAWVVPIRKTNRLAQRYFLGYCPVCLARDEVPYFRREWRLAWAVACPVHDCLLLEACPYCGANVAFHQGDYGHTLTPHADRIGTCWRCGNPLAHNIAASRAPDDVLWLVHALHRAVASNTSGLSDDLPIRLSHPLCLFGGLHVLMAAISSNARTMPLLAGIRSIPGCPNVILPEKRGRPFEEWQIRDRTALLHLVAWLIEDWPARFRDACHAVGIMGSAFRTYRPTQELPFWLERAMQNGVDRPWYRVTQREVQSARNYLIRRWMKPTGASLAKLLGHTPNRPRP